MQSGKIEKGSRFRNNQKGSTESFTALMILAKQIIDNFDVQLYCRNTIQCYSVQCLRAAPTESRFSTDLSTISPKCERALKICQTVIYMIYKHQFRISVFFIVVATSDYRCLQYMFEIRAREGAFTMLEPGPIQI